MRNTSYTFVLTWFSTTFSIFNSKLCFVGCPRIFLTKNVILFVIFSKKKSLFLEKIDIKNGFSDSFPQKICILLYTFQL